MKLYGFGPTHCKHSGGLKELDADFEFIPRRAGPAEPRFRHFRGPAVSKAGDWTDCFILGQSGERPER